MIPYHLRSFLGGVSDFEDKGIAGSFKAGSKSLSIRKPIDSLTCQQALTDDFAPGTMTELPLFQVPASDGNTYFFLRNGTIYRRNAAGAYSLVFTDSNESGLIIGAAEWFDNAGNTYLYWATATRLNRKKILGPGYTNAEPWADVNADAGWPKANLTNTTWHTMKVVVASLQIANANQLAMVGYDNSYTNNALQLVPGTYAKCLIERNVYAIIGATRKDNKEESMLYVWDTNAQNPNNRKGIPVANINAMIDTEIALMQIGSNGQLYISDLNTIQPILFIPGGGQCYPDGVTADQGLALFGIFGNTAGYNGIWSYGRLDKQHSIVLNFEYPLDCDEIGSVTKVGTDILITYRKGTTYGVKKVDVNTKAPAEYHTLDLVAPVGTRRYPIPLGRQLAWGRVVLGMSELPAGCAVEVWYRLDKKAVQWTPPSTGVPTDANGWIQANMLGEGGTSGPTQCADAGTREAVFALGERGRVFEANIKLIPSGNLTPEIHEVNVYFDAG